MEHFQPELAADLDDGNDHRIKEKRKGLPSAIHRQQALSDAETFFAFKYDRTFWGAIHICSLCLITQIIIEQISKRLLPHPRPNRSRAGQKCWE